MINKIAFSFRFVSFSFLFLSFSFLFLSFSFSASFPYDYQFGPNQYINPEIYTSNMKVKVQYNYQNKWTDGRPEDGNLPEIKVVGSGAYDSAYRQYFRYNRYHIWNSYPWLLWDRDGTNYLPYASDYSGNVVSLLTISSSYNSVDVNEFGFYFYATDYSSCANNRCPITSISTQYVDGTWYTGLRFTQEYLPGRMSSNVTGTGSYQGGGDSSPYVAYWDFNTHTVYYWRGYGTGGVYFSPREVINSVKSKPWDNAYDMGAGDYYLRTTIPNMGVYDDIAISQVGNVQGGSLYMSWGYEMGNTALPPSYPGAGAGTGGTGGSYERYKPVPPANKQCGIYYQANLDTSRLISKCIDSYNGTNTQFSNESGYDAVLQGFGYNNWGNIFTSPSDYDWRYDYGEYCGTAIINAVAVYNNYSSGAWSLFRQRAWNIHIQGNDSINVFSGQQDVRCRDNSDTLGDITLTGGLNGLYGYNNGKGLRFDNSFGIFKFSDLSACFQNFNLSFFTTDSFAVGPFGSLTEIMNCVVTSATPELEVSGYPFSDILPPPVRYCSEVTSTSRVGLIILWITSFTICISLFKTFYSFNSKPKA